MKERRGRLWTFRSRHEESHQAGKAIFVDRAKTVRDGTVDIQDAQQPPRGVKQRNDDLRPRGRVAGDVTGKHMNVGHDQWLPALGGRPADTFADRDPHTGDPALERAQHELPFSFQVEAAPVDVVQGVIQEGTEVGGVGDEVAFPFEERTCRRHQAVEAIGVVCQGRIHQGCFIHPLKLLQTGPSGGRGSDETRLTVRM